MPKTTIYYETARNGLIPCEFIGWTRTPLDMGYNATVRLKREGGGYYKNEVIRVPARLIVVKAGIKNYHQMVKPAILPVLSDDNILQKPDYWD